MTDIFINFLARISASNSIYKTFTRSNLNDKFTNSTYQELLNMTFGPDGTTTLSITDNEVLSLGARSFFLKLAIFATQQECYNFLDYIYAAIINKTPGFYWELLTSIKAINDHVNDTLHKYTIDNYEYNSVPCNTLFFKNVGNSSTDILSVDLVRPAIWTLIMNKVSELKLKADSLQLEPDYRTQQLDIAAFLDRLTPNSKWRFFITHITKEQIDQCDQTTQIVYACFQALSKAPLHMALILHEQNCGCDPGKYALIVSFNKEFEESLQKQQVDFMQEDRTRYGNELRDQQPPAKKMRARFV